jgi:RNA polymerase sigma factor (sigma-70 family)
MNNYSLYPPASQDSEAPSTRFRTEEPVSVEEAMRRHDGLVHAFIRRQGGGAISYEDALQAGRIGLWRSILGYDPTRGTAFSTYAWVAIGRTIHQAVDQEAKGRPGWSKALPLAWYCPDLDEWVDQHLIKEALYTTVARLPDRLKRVIVFRYGLAGYPLRTLKQLGTELGITYERVRQLQQDGLAWLRHPARSSRLRQLVDKNTAIDYRQALASNAALRRKRRRE